MHASKMYGYTVGETSFDWGKLKEMRDAYVRRLNGIYHRNVEKSGVTLVYGVRKLAFVCSVRVSATISEIAGHEQSMCGVQTAERSANSERWERTNFFFCCCWRHGVRHSGGSRNVYPPLTFWPACFFSRKNRVIPPEQRTAIYWSRHLSFSRRRRHVSCVSARVSTALTNSKLTLRRGARMLHDTSAKRHLPQEQRDFDSWLENIKQLAFIFHLALLLLLAADGQVRRAEEGRGGRRGVHGRQRDDRGGREAVDA